MKRTAPAVARNKDALLAELAKVLPLAGTVVEVASGSGEHAVHFARGLPGVTWQPTDCDPAALASIGAWRAEAALPNLATPLPLDVMAAWPVDRADAVVCINMIHIAPWAATVALFVGAARLLAIGAPLVTYGPYRFPGGFTAPSNAEFDQSLRARDPRWGVRDVREVAAVAAPAGFELEATVAMPANNHTLVWRRT
ncbi:MAG: DUF938 domain-containing protein [Kofleriaceae bacterium]